MEIKKFVKYDEDIPSMLCINCNCNHLKGYELILDSNYGLSFCEECYEKLFDCFKQNKYK